MKNYLMLIVLSIALWNCNKEETIEVNNVGAPSEEAYEIADVNIDVSVIDGTLHFKDKDAFFEGLRALDLLDIESRKAWEAKVGFQSIRSVYDEVMEMYENGAHIETEKYEAVISFEGEVPRIRHFDPFTANIINMDGVFYYANSIGSIRRGCNVLGLRRKPGGS